LLALSEAIFDEIVAHAHEDPTIECCGMVAGRDGVATRVLGVRNAAERPEVTYSMDPNEQHRAYMDIEDAGEELVAIYHSHPPAGAYFSETDLARAYAGEHLAWPGVLYIVVGMKDSAKGPKGVKAFEIADHQATEVELSIV
jgi:proteasome lid subunit RPN8/RPN11